MNAVEIKQAQLNKHRVFDRAPAVKKHTHSAQSAPKLKAISGTANNCKNTPLVMLRGLARGQFHWSSFKSELQKAFPSRDIIFLSLTG